MVGISTLIAVLGTPSAGNAVETFHRAWLMMIANGAAAAIVATTLGRVRARHVETAEQIGMSKAELLGAPLPSRAAELA